MRYTNVLELIFFYYRSGYVVESVVIFLLILSKYDLHNMMN